MRRAGFEHDGAREPRHRHGRSAISNTPITELARPIRPPTPRRAVIEQRTAMTVTRGNSHRVRD